jgi:hypothetical protein
MKKLYSLIAVMLMTVASAFASVTINVNVGEVCTLSYTDNSTYSQVSKVLDEGENVIDDIAYFSLSLSYDNDYIFTSLTQGENAMSISSSKYISFYPTDGATYNVTIKHQEDAYDAKCTVVVDDPSAVSIRTSGLSRTISLQEGENEIAFISSLESPLQIASATYGKSLYKIIKNGTEETVSSYGNYVTVSNGDRIEVYSQFPDIKYHLSFKYSEGAEGFITGVSVDNVAVDDFSNGVDVQVGSSVTITGNTNDYKFESMVIGANTLSYFYGSTTFTMSADTEVVVNAHKYGEFTFTVNADDPSNFTLYKGYSYNGITYDLVEGANELKISENNSTIQFNANSGCYFTSITANGEEKFYSGSTSVSFSVTDGMVINVVSGKINRDQTAVVYINDKSLVSYFSFQRSDRSDMSVATGYNTIEFYSGDVPFYFSAYGQTSDLVYLNDVEVAPMYSGSAARQINEVPNNSVFKIFFNETPETYTVTVEAPENVTVSATKDLIAAVADYSSFTVLGESQVDLTVDSNDVKVLVNNSEVSAVDGKYTFTVSADTQVSITASTSGVENVASDANTTFDVYNLQGVRVAHNVENLNNLPAGIYIANGKKVVVK